MKLSLLLILFLQVAFISTIKVSAQNVSINILTLNSGLVSKGSTVFLDVTLNNTNPTDSVPMYKLRPQISFPISLVSIPATGHILPPGWSITFNAGGVVRLSNGTDKIEPNGARTILLMLKGENYGGPYTISGNLLFSNGIAPGAVSGIATAGDNPADNSSTSTCEVIK